MPDPSVTELADQLARERPKPDLDAELGDALQDFVATSIAFDCDDASAVELEASRSRVVEVMGRFCTRQTRRYVTSKEGE